MSLKSIAQKVWDKIPTPYRSVLNVGVGAAVAAGAHFILNLKGVPSDWNAAEQGFAVATSTAFWRAVNPLDKAYGVGASTGSAYVPDLALSADPAPVDPAVAVAQ